MEDIIFKEGKQGQLTHKQVIPKWWILWYLFSVCGTFTIQKKKTHVLHHSHKVFYLPKENMSLCRRKLEEKQRYVINMLDVFFIYTDLFQNTLRHILIFNIEKLEQIPILAYISSSKFTSV